MQKNAGRILRSVPMGDRAKARCGVLLAATIALVGCEGSVTVDLGSSAAADPAVVQVLVDLEGVEFGKDGGGSEQLVFEDPLRVDLAELSESDLFRLFTDEELEDGRYTSVRLLFENDEDDEDDVVVIAGGEELPLIVNGTATSAVDFTIDKDDSSRESIVLTFDLRQSLSFNDDDEEYSLSPVVRAVRPEEAGRIVGNVTAGCSAGRSLLQGGAVYLFEGEDIEPDDRDNEGVEPYLTARVGGSIANSLTSYSFAYVPEGDYTIALTCRGNFEDAATSDELDFQNISNVEVEAEDTVTRDIGS